MGKPRGERTKHRGQKSERYLLNVEAGNFGGAEGAAEERETRSIQVKNRLDASGEKKSTGEEQ